MFLGDFPEDFTAVTCMFTTHDSTGAPVAPSSALEAADLLIYKDGNAAQKTSTNGVTMTSPFDSLTGLHTVVIDTSNDTGDTGFWEANHVYTLVLSPDETVDSVAVRKVVGQFTLGMVRTAAAAALTTYDPPTNAEMEARTLVAMFGQPANVRWTALLMGLAVDLLSTLPLANAAGDVRIIGPTAIAFVIAAQLVMSVRSVMMRRNPLTLGVLAMLAAMASAIALVAIFTMRSLMFDAMSWSVTHELLVRGGGAIYTGVIGTLLAFALLPLASLLGLKIDSTLIGGRAAKY